MNEGIKYRKTKEAKSKNIKKQKKKNIYVYNIINLD